MCLICVNVTLEVILMDSMALKKVKDNHDVRLNIRLPKYLQEFYKDRANDLAIPYTNLITLILYNYYADQNNKFLSTQIRDLLEILEQQSEHISKKEMLDQIRYVLEKEVDYNTYDQFIF